MFGDNNNSPSKSTGSPNRVKSTSRKVPPPSTHSLKNKARMGLQNAISKAFSEKILPNTAIREENRNKQNPNNAIFIYENKNENVKIVYKIGLWQDRDRCIRNEFIAYTLLLKEKLEGMNKHYPEMFNCQKIEGTKYAMITLQFIPGITMVCIPFNNSNMNTNENNSNNKSSKCNDSLENTIRDNLIQEARQYLEDIGITHNDERENLFVHSINNEKTFLWMDFEAATFDKRQLNMCSKLLLQNNVQIRTTNSNFTSPIMNSSPTKKRKPSNNNNNSTNLFTRLDFKKFNK